MKVYVINLARATDRWEHMARQFEALGDGVDIRRFEAVDGQNDDHPLFERYNDLASRRWKGSSLSRGQLGCFASHYLVWEECLHLNEPVVILEDDAVLDSELFHEFLAHLHTLDHRFECLRLFRNHSKHHRAIFVRKIGALDIVKYTKGPMRGTGYYLTPAAASKFIKASKQWFLPVDITMDRFWENKVECFGIIPPVLSNDDSLKSTIGYEPRRHKRKILTKVFREIFAFREGVAKHRSNLVFWVFNRFFKEYK